MDVILSFITFKDYVTNYVSTSKVEKQKTHLVRKQHLYSWSPLTESFTNFECFMSISLKWTFY